MNDIRRDPYSDRLVIFAEQRAARPNDYLARADAARQCPFCEGNEHLTTPEVFAVRPEGTPADQPGWRLRVVPNKYPAVSLAAPRQSASPETLAARGVHEVVIETPHHVVRTADVPTDRWFAPWAYARRLVHWREEGMEYGIAFKNFGPAAGASREHLHSQLVVLPFVPPRIERELSVAQAAFDKSGRCPFCLLLEEELAAQVRLLAAGPRFVAFCPRASRFPYETWVVPRSHASHFDRSNEEALLALGEFLHRVLVRLEEELPGAAYNCVLQTAPLRMDELPYYHWRIEILPRLTGIAGFELGTGIFINQVLPEVAAGRLRATDASNRRAGSR